MRKLILPLLCLTTLSAWSDTIPWRASGDSLSASFFQQWYHRSDLIYYMEAYNDHTVVETTTYGQWWIPDRLTVGIEGLPFTANRYYIDDMRVNDLFQPGSTRYVPNMQHYDLRMNTTTGQLFFTPYAHNDTVAYPRIGANYVQAAYNFGQLGNGEPMPGTTEVLNIAHISPMQSADHYKHVSARRHQRGAGQIDAAYTFTDGQGNAYPQHIYAAYGQRLLTREDQSGLILDNPFYRADYYKVQADGTFPIRLSSTGTQDMRLGYRLNFSGKEDGGSEYLFNYGEVYDHKNYSGMVYLKRQYLTTGLNWSTDVVHHSDLSFSKNILDQDGENFLPFVPDGKTHSLSWAVNYSQPLLSWLNIHIDAYNSLVHFSPEKETFSNLVYIQKPIDYLNAPSVIPPVTPLCQYQWQSRSFTGGLLENTIGLDAHYALGRHVDMKAHLDLTADAMLIRNKSKVSPNWQAGISFDIHPCKWFDMSVELSHERMPYTMDYLLYFSDDYLNGTVVSAADMGKPAATNVQTTGGQYHHYQKNLRQTSFAELNLPLHFRFGRHEIVLQQSYRRYFNVWYTRYKDGIDANGTFENINNVQVFFPSQSPKEYEVGYTDAFGSNWLLNNPYYVAQLTRYSYYGRKVLFSLSWQSFVTAGYSALGNGPTANTIGVLSETTANPNTQNVLDNQSGLYKGVGRVDSDKGFICRIYVGYNICKWVQTGVTLKWTDGKPFTDWQYYEKDGQVVVLPYDSRGTNPTDEHFGKRHCAKYNVDWHVQGQWNAGKVPMTLNVECYNLWDFCHDLAEMGFTQDVPYAKRSSMIMDIPVGLLSTLTIGL